MFLRFRFENAGRFRRPQELSLVASGDDPEDPRLRDGPGGLKLLPSAAILGPHGSGKTTALDAMYATCKTVYGNGWDFRPAPWSERKPSRFGLDLAIGGAVWSYDLEVQGSPVRVLSESLSVDGATWFLREGDEFRPRKPLLRGPRKEDGGTTVVAARGRSPESPLHPLLDALWRAGTHFSRRGDVLRGVEAEDRSAFRRAAAALDLGFVDVRPGDYETEVRREGPKGAWVPWRDSGGAAALRLLASALPALREGSLLLVDDLDEGVHPVVAAAVVGLFSDPRANPRGAQLVFSTNCTPLLGPVPFGPGRPALRKDQAWVLERPATARRGLDGTSSLVPLSDYRDGHGPVRSAYESGRFGGLPVVGDLAAAVAAED